MNFYLTNSTDPYAGSNVSFAIFGAQGPYNASVYQYGQIVELDRIDDAIGNLRLNLNNGSYLNSSGEFYEPLAFLNGRNAIVGRSIVLRNTNGSAIAQCVVGIASDNQTSIQLEYPNVTKAACTLVGTSAVSPFESGYIDFELLPEGMSVRTIISNHPPGFSFWHVHEYGNISDSARGLATGGHLGRECGRCRPSGLQEIGAIGDSSLLFANQNGQIRDWVLDRLLTFSGNTSIVGRGIIIHATTAPPRASQCVIGITREEDYIPPSDPIPEGAVPVPIILRATTIIQSTIEGRQVFGRNVSGYIDYTLQPSGYIKVSFYVSGLFPNAFHPWHVHIYGDIAGDRGDGAVAGHFIGFPSSRAEVAQLNNNTALYADSRGVARGEFIDTEIRLNGRNSIIGRAVIIHHPTLLVPRIAVGAIGRNRESSSVTAERPDLVNQAICQLEPTLDGINASITGFVLFEYLPGAENITVRSFISGLNESDFNPWHVHRYGDIIDYDEGQALGGHFIGFPSTRAEVGQIDGNRPIFGELYGVSGSVFLDQEITLSGWHSIVGRGMIIHGGTRAGRASQRYAQCVVAITRIGNPADFATGFFGQNGTTPFVVKAQATIVPVPSFPGNSVRGYVEFSRDFSGVPQFPGVNNTRGLIVRYHIVGLSPGPHNWHIHVYGDEVDPFDGAGPPFIGLNPMRRAGIPNEIGQIGEGFPIIADQNGVASGVHFDNMLELNGPNAIIGRGVVIHGTSTNSIVYVGFGVIGRVQELNNTAMDHAPVERAACYFNATSLPQDPNARYPELFGWVRYTAQGNTGVLVEFLFHGLTPGPHPWHVHLLGDRLDNDGFAVMDHFIGVNPRRPANIPQEVGSINDGIPLLADSNGIARGRFIDSQIRLNGNNSILGRGMIIHEQNTALRSAQCVIGRIRELDPLSGPTTVNRNRITRASCTLSPTSVAISRGLNIQGTFRFQLLPSNLLRVSFRITGLQDGAHSWHVHELGNIKDSEGNAVLGHFIGRVDRPVGLDEIGNLNNGAAIVSRNGLAQDIFDDRFASLNGVASIIGRGMIIHDPNSPAIRLAQCVIGIDEEAPTSPAQVPDYMTRRAVAFLTPAAPFLANNVTGLVEFERMTSGGFSIRVCASGLPQGNLRMEIRTEGDLTGVGSLFRGTGTPAFSGSISNGEILRADANGFVAELMTDSLIDSFGPNSIIGRSVVIYGSGSSANTIMAFGVIGLAEERALPNVVVTAVPDLNPTTAAPLGVSPGSSRAPDDNSIFPLYGIFLISLGALVFVSIPFFIWRRSRMQFSHGVSDRLLEGEGTELPSLGQSNISL